MDQDTYARLADELGTYDMANPPRRKQLHYQAVLETRDLLRQILNVVVENRLGARPEDDDTNGEAQPVAHRFAEADREIYGAKLDTAEPGRPRNKSTAAKIGMLWGRALIIGETWHSVMGDVVIDRTGTYYGDVPWYSFKPAADPHVHELVRLTADRLEHFLLPDDVATEKRTFADVVRERDVARGLADEMAKVADKAMADVNAKREQIEGVSRVVSELNRRIDLQKEALHDLRTRHATLCEDHTALEIERDNWKREAEKLETERDQALERLAVSVSNNAALETDRDSWKREAHAQRERANKATTERDVARNERDSFRETSRKFGHERNAARDELRMANDALLAVRKEADAKAVDPDAAEQIEALKLALEEANRRPATIPFALHSVARIAWEARRLDRDLPHDSASGDVHDQRMLETFRRTVNAPFVVSLADAYRQIGGQE